MMDDLSRPVDSGEARRFLASRLPKLPIQKLYVMKPGYASFRGDDGEDISLVYEMQNKPEDGLGKYKLPVGKMRLYGDDGMDSTIFLGEDILPETFEQSGNFPQTYSHVGLINAAFRLSRRWD